MRKGGRGIFLGENGKKSFEIIWTCTEKTVEGTSEESVIDNLNPVKRGKGKPKWTLMKIVEQELFVNISKSFVNERVQQTRAIHIANLT